MFEKLLQTLAKALTKAGIPYVIIGGQAVLRYAEPRLTKDIDVTVGLVPAELSRLLSVIEEEGWKVLPETPADFVEATFVLPAEDSESGIRLDFIFSFTPFEKEAIATGIFVYIEGTAVKFVSPENLIIHKVFAGRPRDLEDMRSLLRKQTRLDLGHIEHWLMHLSEGAETNYLELFRELMKG